MSQSAAAAAAAAGKGFSDVRSAPFRSDPPLPIAASACDRILTFAPVFPGATRSQTIQHPHSLTLRRHRNAILSHNIRKAYRYRKRTLAAIVLRSRCLVTVRKPAYRGSKRTSLSIGSSVLHLEGAQTVIPLTNTTTHNG